MARIIVVEDEEMFREALSELLVRAGHEVETVASSTETFQVAGRFAPEILIVDWMLRGDDSPGIEIARELKKHLPELITIVISGYPADDLRAQSGDFPVFAFIEKPFDADEVRAVVMKASSAL